MAATTVAFSWAGLTAGAKAKLPQGIKLYVFSSGFLNIDESALQAGAAPGKIDIPVGSSSSTTEGKYPVRLREQ